jgi:hypothetical protein
MEKNAFIVFKFGVPKAARRLLAHAHHSLVFLMAFYLQRFDAVV